MKTKNVKLIEDKNTLSNSFKAGDSFRVLGPGCGTVRLSRIGDNAKLICEPWAVGLEPKPVIMAPVANKTLAKVEAKIWGAPHSDESGNSRRIVICTVLAGKDSGETAMHMTPKEEAEYNRGMAMMAQLG